jgi:hypothetical protein
MRQLVYFPAHGGGCLRTLRSSECAIQLIYLFYLQKTRSCK